MAMGVLYPGSLIAVVSRTADQATLVLRKIDDYFSRNPEILREIELSGSHAAVQLNQNKGCCKLKNGSKIESYSLGTFRGNRAKVVVIDEAPEVKKADIEAVIKPVRNMTRDNCVQLGIPDYPSKLVSITSACLKSNYFYEAFVSTLKQMSRGDKSCFACALNYEAAARVGISPMSFFENERRTMEETKFAMEYNSIFIGAEVGSVFPYELTERCRVLQEVEIAMPKSSTSDYVIGVDLATSSAKYADNAVVSVVKLIELDNGNYLKKLVYIRSFHGKRLDALANEVRRLLVKFPRTIKVVFDHRGLGDAFPQFLSQPWVDPSGKEYPPLVMDTEKTTIHNAVPLLHPVVATSTINQQIVSALTIALEQETVELPINSRHVTGNKIKMRGEDDDDDSAAKALVPEEKAIFIETDALQIEMGNVVSKVSAAGSVIYDVAKSTQHKDRYSSLGMALMYISSLEDARRKTFVRGSAEECIGIVTKF